MQSKALEINSFSEERAQKLLHYVNNGDLKRVKEFLKASKNWLYVTFDDRGKMPIHIAAIRGDTEMAFYFFYIDPALLNKTDKQNRTPLHFAAMNNHEDFIDSWLSLGANSDLLAKQVKEEQDTSPLGYAKAYGCKNSFKILLTHKIDTILQEGDTKAILALIDTLNASFLLEFEYQLYLARRLVEIGALTPLKYLMSLDKAHLVLSQKGSYRDDLLQLAAYYGQTEMLSYLVSLGLNLPLKAYYEPLQNQNNETIQDAYLKTFLEHFTPEDFHFDHLVTATKKGHLKIAQFLVSTGVDFKCRIDETKEYLIHIAARKGWVELVDYYLSLDSSQKGLQNGKKQTPLVVAIHHEHEDVVLCLTQAKFNLTEQTLDLEHEADQIKTLYSKEQSALNLAKANQFDDCVSLLQEACLTQFKALNLDCNQSNLEKATTLGHSLVVNYLLENGGLLTTKLLQLAALNGHLDLIETFLIRDASLLNLEALFDAAFNGHDKLVALLLTKKTFNKSDLEKISRVVKNTEHHKVICLLLLELTKENRASLPELLTKAEQVLELIQLEPSLANDLLSNITVLKLLNSEHVQVNKSLSKTKQILELYKPANRRKSMYLRVDQTVEANQHCATLFKPHAQLGKGGFGLVRQFCAENGEQIAVKSPINTLTKDKQGMKDDIKQECHLTQLASGGIHSLFHFNIKTDYHYRFIKPCHPGLKADVFMRRIKEPQKLVEVIYLIAKELVNVHQFGIVHGDLKEANILISEGPKVKIIDYGYAGHEGELTAPRRNKDPLIHSWFAPECRGATAVEAHPSQDIFSFGFFLEDVICNHPCQEILLESYPFISVFIQKAQALSPKDRPRLKDFCEALLEVLLPTEQCTSGL